MEYDSVSLMQLMTCQSVIFQLLQSRRQVMAKFNAPVIQDNPSGWGPCAVPDKYKDMPYQPFSKGDRLGKVCSSHAGLFFSHFGSSNSHCCRHRLVVVRWLTGLEQLTRTKDTPVSDLELETSKLEKMTLHQKTCSYSRVGNEPTSGQIFH